MSLELGGPSRAAASIGEALPQLQDCLSQLLRDVQGAYDGYRGAGANALAQALGQWFDAAQDIPRALADYQGRLVMVDITTARVDSRGTQNLAQSGASLPSGLNLQ